MCLLDGSISHRLLVLCLLDGAGALVVCSLDGRILDGVCVH